MPYIDSDTRIAELTEQLSLSDRLLVAEMRAKAELTDLMDKAKQMVGEAIVRGADQQRQIAELTAEVARLTGLADGMYRRGEALLLAVDTFIATYGSEDVSLEDLHELTDADAAMCEAMEPYEAKYIARNALEDGV